MTALILAAVMGLSIGFLAAILGIGGGVLLVPMLHLLLGLEMHEAIGTSLFVVFFLSSSAMVSYLRKRLILWRLALIFECGSTIGAFTGAHASHFLPSRLLKVAFSLVLLYTAYKMWQGAKGKTSSSGIEGAWRSEEKLLQKYKDPSYVLLLIGLGFIAGFLSGLLGIGGGVVKVPIMKLILSIPIHNAVATSAFMITLTSFVGMSTHLLIGDVKSLVGLALAPSVMIGSQLGARTAIRMRGATISKIFAVLLIFIALRMILELS